MQTTHNFSYMGKKEHLIETYTSKQMKQTAIKQV